MTGTVKETAKETEIAATAENGIETTTMMTIDLPSVAEVGLEAPVPVMSRILPMLYL